MSKSLFLLFAAGIVALAQDAPVNLDFETGVAGKVPTGWFVPNKLAEAGFSAELRREGCKAGFGCAVVLLPAVPPANLFGNLMQRFSAVPYRGKTVKVTAWVRADITDAGDRAQFWIRVDNASEMAYLDNGEPRPITNKDWQPYTVEAPVTQQADDLNIGLIAFGKARGWVDDISIEALAPTVDVATARGAIQEIYLAIDAAFEKNDIDILLNVSTPDAFMSLPAGPQPIRAMVEAIRSQLKGKTMESKSSITNIEMAGADAIVSVRNEGALISGGIRTASVTTYRDRWRLTADGWKLKESGPLSSREVAPDTPPDVVAKVAAELRRHAVRLSSAEAGGESADLTAFGKAVGNARIVSLGEASHGTREFFQMKHRLLEYLVKHKGFTVFAIEANWPEALAVDRYIKTGEGDPKAALAGMYFWTWNTEEVLAMIEWMRAYNKAAGKAVLTFTSFDMQTYRVAAERAIAFVRKTLPGETAAVQAAYDELKKVRPGQMLDPAATTAAEKAQAIAKLFDTHRRRMVEASSAPEWRDARQAAEIVRQAAAMAAPGAGSAYRDEMMARNVEWLLNEVHPKEKIVLWAHNGHVRTTEAGGIKWMGAWLRERYGDEMYVVGFAFRKGDVRAIGRNGTQTTALSSHIVPPSPEGTGDAVFSAAGIPIFFLDLKSLPDTALRRWLSQPNRFRSLGAVWFMNDPEANFSAEIMTKSYNGVIFVEEGHAAKGLPSNSGL